MSSTIIFLLGGGPDEPIVVGAIADGAASARRVTVAELETLRDEAGRADRVIAVLRGEDVAVRILETPPKSPSQAKAAARLMLEDELAEPVDRLFSAVAPYGAALRIAATRKALLDSWLAVFRDAGIALDGLYVDCLLAPSSAEGGTLILAGGRVVASVAGRGFALEQDIVPWAVLFGEATGVTKFAVLAEPEDWDSFPFRHAAERADGADDEKLAAFYAKAAEAPDALNFLQGSLRPRTPWRAILGPWRRPAALAGVAAGLALLAVLAGGVRDLNAAAHWRRAGEAIHKTAFPDVPVAKAADNARALLGRGGGQSFAGLTAAVAKAAGADAKIEITRLRFDAAQGTYFVSVKSVTDANIEALKSRLAGAGLVVADNGGYRRLGDTWAGELSVRAK